MDTLPSPPRDAVGVILGSAFNGALVTRLGLSPVVRETPFGPHRLFEGVRPGDGRPIVISVRHGLPHDRLPNQINYRAQAWALAAAGCGALVVNSSVGVMVERIPLYTPLLVTDLLMPENRLPDGSTCTIFPEPTPGQAHLVLTGGLFSRLLAEQLRTLEPERIGGDPAGSVVFVYAGGPRSKTPAENRYWARVGGEVNSMTVGPEVVLANELEIPTAALVVGHKHSVPGLRIPPVNDLKQSLVDARAATESILERFLLHGLPVAFENSLYRY
jgi:5'-methylthioadenosine phosphorylase